MRWHTPGKGKFSAIVWKELRETCKWGVPALLSITGLTVYNMRGALLVQGLGETPDFDSLLSWSPVLLPAIAFFIGLAQVVRESRGDAWGFLTHRPAPRSTLFWGKVTAGLFVYLIAV